MKTRARVAVLLVAGLLAGCSGGAGGSTEADPRPATTSAGRSPTSPDETAPRTTAGSPTSDPLPPVRDELSLAAIMRRPVDGGSLRLGQLLETTADFTRRVVTYSSDGLTVSGVLLRPRGRGPFPAVVLNHGYIEPSAYTSGQGLAREQAWLASAGYVVLHTDYRGHAGSDPATALDRESLLGYTRDAANAVDALAGEQYVDPERIGMLGRSMGGGVTQNVLVAYPGLVDAAVIYASVSSDFVQSQREFREPDQPVDFAPWFDRFGTPSRSPEFYAGLSARTHFDLITEPVLSLHGSVDDVCPPGWARRTDALMRTAGVDSTLRFFADEGHTFYGAWQDSIELADAFLRRET